MRNRTFFGFLFALFFLAHASAASYSILVSPSAASNEEKTFYLKTCELVALEPVSSPLWKGQSADAISQYKKKITEGKDIRGKTGGFLGDGGPVIDKSGNVRSDQASSPIGSEASDVYVGCLLQFGWSWNQPDSAYPDPLVVKDGSHSLLRNSKSRLSGSSLFWIDNNRVIFTTPSDQYCSYENSNRPPENLSRVAIFDTASLTVVQHGNDIGIANLCYADGRISYSRSANVGSVCSNQLEDVRGLMGAESLKKNREGVFGDSCLPWSELPKPDWITYSDYIGSKYAPLKPEHGWIEKEPPPCCGRAIMAAPVAIYPPNTDKGKGISIREAFPSEYMYSHPGIGPLRYVPYKGAYLYRIAWSYSTLPDKQSVMWWLYPSGKVEEVVRWRSVGDWTNIGDRQIIPTAAGIFVITERMHGKNAPGLYLAQDGNKRLRLVMAGQLKEKTFSLSPDGCKLAFGVKKPNDDSDKNNVYELHTLDLCRLVQ